MDRRSASLCRYTFISGFYGDVIELGFFVVEGGICADFERSLKLVTCQTV